MEAVQYWVPGDNPDTAGVATTPSTLANFVPPLKGSLQCQPGEGQRCTGALGHGHTTMVYAEIVGSGSYNVTVSHLYGLMPQNTIAYARLVCPWPYSYKLNDSEPEMHLEQENKPCLCHLGFIIAKSFKNS